MTNSIKWEDLNFFHQALLGWSQNFKDPDDSAYIYLIIFLTKSPALMKSMVIWIKYI